MAGERLLQVRLDESRTAKRHAQSNEAAKFRAQRRITNPHFRLRSDLRNCIKQDAGRHTRVLEAVVEECDPVG